MTLAPASFQRTLLGRLPLSPAHALRNWPADQPVAALLSASLSDAPAARWSILARPSARVPRREDARAALTQAACPQRAPVSGPDEPPFAGGWIGWLSYDLGRDIEPKAQAEDARPLDDRDHPDHCLLRCDSAIAFDHHKGVWWSVGEPDFCEDLFSSSASPQAPGYSVGRLASSMGRERYERAVERVVEYIAAGDVFQANIAHRLTGSFTGSPRALAADLLDQLGSWYAACIEPLTPGSAVLSASPELFLEFEPESRRIVTRPIKGTLAVRRPPVELLESEKDAAELAMIVDLMRNDLGRVCEYGSVRVEEARSIERHGGVGAAEDAGVHHSVATVSGRLRDDRDFADLLGATFPPGSITGAPKIRAMQIIDEVEPVRRGPYCGAVGYISDCGRAAFNVAIRTACVTTHCDAPQPERFDDLRAEVDYAVGAGIVADSTPESEWRETLAKAEGFLRVVGQEAPA